MLEQLELHLTSSSELFSDLRRTGKYNDVSLVSSDGRMVRAHKVVLGANSGWFTRIFQQLEQEQERFVIALAGATFEDLQHLMDLLYYGRVVMASQSVENIVKLGKELDIDGIRASRLLTGEKRFRREDDTYLSKKSTSQEDVQEENMLRHRHKKNSANSNLNNHRKDDEENILKTETTNIDEESVINNNLDFGNDIDMLTEEPTELSMDMSHDTGNYKSRNQSNEGRKHSSAPIIGDLSEISGISVPSQGSVKSNSIPHPEVEELCQLLPVDKEAKFMNAIFIKKEEKLEKKIACKWCAVGFTPLKVFLFCQFSVLNYPF